MLVDLYLSRTKEGNVVEQLRNEDTGTLTLLKELVNQELIRQGVIEHDLQVGGAIMDELSGMDDNTLITTMSFVCREMHERGMAEKYPELFGNTQEAH